jgi:hypothetical protein
LKHAQSDLPFEELNKSADLPNGAVTHGPATFPSAPFSTFAVSYPPAPFVSFQGLNDDNTFTPPDTQGAVGPNHVVTMLNTQVRIQNRLGTTNYLTKSLFNWWTNAGPFTLVSDPKILYDPYSERWIASVQANPPPFDTNGLVLLAVSQTTDPTGSWY